MITLNEAKNMMTPEAYEKLKKMTTVAPVINIGNKVNNDILMQALCRAVTEGVIKVDSLDEKTVKLLNSETNSLAAVKLGHILEKVRMHQPNIVCVVYMTSQNMSERLHEWVFTGPTVNLIGMFDTVLKDFNITPTTVRTKMTNTLKPTIVNNIAQLIAKYEHVENKNDIKVSITTITRLVNMEDHLLFAEFCEET